jgi:ABC-type antimicrobial peptide transport system permease subunit
MGSRLQPAVIGGLFIGVLSTLPFVNIVNICCCLWVVLGGALAAYLLQQDSTEPITGADGALIGLMAGGIGALVGTVLSIPIDMYFGPIMRDWVLRYAEGQELPPEFLEMLNQQMTAAGIVLKLIWNLFAYVVFGMLGGVLGVALFRRKPAA